MIKLHKLHWLPKTKVRNYVSDMEKPIATFLNFKVQIVNIDIEWSNSHIHVSLY